MTQFSVANIVGKFKRLLQEEPDDAPEEDEPSRQPGQHRPSLSSLRQVADMKSDPEAVSPASFNEVLRLLGSMHETEALQLRALRSENATLRAALGPRSPLVATAACTNLSSVAAAAEADAQAQAGAVATPAHAKRVSHEAAYVSTNINALAHAKRGSDVSAAMPEVIAPLEIQAGGHQAEVLEIPAEEDRTVSLPVLESQATSACSRARSASMASPKENCGSARASLESNEIMTEVVPKKELQLMDTWEQHIHHPRVAHHKSAGDSTERGFLAKVSTRIGPGDNDNKDYYYRFLSYPNSPHRLMWDGLAAFLVLYDVIMLPMSAFKYPENVFTIGMDWLTLLFWTINVPASLTVGYIANGQMVMNRRRIVLHYMKTWFVLDILVLLPDWAFIFMTDSSSQSSVEEHSGVLRVLRISRMARLARLAKLRRILQSLYYAIESEYVSIVTHIVQMILLVLAFCHVIGCVWFLVAMEQQDGPSWVKDFGFEDVSWQYQYALAFHWSITQFTPSTNDIAPKNMHERITAICVVVFALVGFSYVVGSITGSLAQLRSLSEESAKQFWDLRRYLTHRHIQPTLALRIEKYLEHAYQRQQKYLHEKGVRLLSMLSEPLMRELQLEIYMPCLKVHPLLASLNETNSLTMQRIAHSALGELKAARDDLFFVPYEQATNMYFLTAGKLWYQPLAEEVGRRILQNEGWVSEPVLWLNSWVHAGALTAAADCDLLLIDPAQFGHMVSKSPPAMDLASQYAQQFVAWLKEIDMTGEVITPADLATAPDFPEMWIRLKRLRVSQPLTVANLKTNMTQLNLSSKRMRRR